jgi:type I site-specific restriction-modification system R (restriction) subunit
LKWIRKKRFLDAVLAINKAYSLCSTLDEAKKLSAEIAFFRILKPPLVNSHMSIKMTATKSCKKQIRFGITPKYQPKNKKGTFILHSPKHYL